MKENIFDVLMYLFENYIEEVIDLPSDNDIIRTELLEAGFESYQVNKAFDWIDSLTIDANIKKTAFSSFRIFSPEEVLKLDIECRNFIIFLELHGILNVSNREIVIDRVLALDKEDISIEKLKWILLMVLLSQPDEEIAFSKMEDFVYDLRPLYLH